VARGRLGKADLADDVVQETFLCALKWLHTYDSKYSFRTWLWTILLNQCSRAAKKIGRQQRVFSAAGEFHGGNTDAALVASDEVSPLDGLLARESAGRVQELLARLPDNQADAVRLRFFGGLKFQEIAEAQGCSLTSAKTRVRLGLLQLSQWLGASQAVLRMTGETP
jgi:RNA polymerase sigma-70 factor (ECF subfamily)